MYWPVGLETSLKDLQLQRLFGISSKAFLVPSQKARRRKMLNEFIGGILALFLVRPVLNIVIVFLEVLSSLVVQAREFD